MLWTILPFGDVDHHVALRVVHPIGAPKTDKGKTVCEEGEQGENRSTPLRIVLGQEDRSADRRAVQKTIVVASARTSPEQSKTSVPCHPRSVCSIHSTGRDEPHFECLCEADASQGYEGVHVVVGHFSDAEDDEERDVATPSERTGMSHDKD